MIDLKQAARIAFEAMRELYAADEIPDLLLEEAELAQEPTAWLVTVSFAGSSSQSPIEAMTGQHGARAFKLFRIDAETGQVLSMKVRIMGPG